MPGMTRRLWISGALCMALTACGNSEADQRKAFSEFLQTRILDRKGARVPQLTEENKTAFGDYAQHYAVITGFHDKMNASVGPGISKVLAAGGITSVGQVISRRDDIATARQTLVNLRQTLDTATSDAEKAHAALKQPADLKLIYDKAFGKVVTQPANAFRDIWPVVESTFDDVIKFADFLAANQAKIKISGVTAEVADPKLLAQLNAQVSGLQKHQSEIQQAQRKLREVMYGE
ncbi:DUF3053 domain-containing protein [Roseiarcaceae bacterium H3SJ34-1]|uniref:DUF3053 domain-containing protein n=1 Tax=Terripilifer ovatus TaxID=3032367 RepID=UPI003AB9753F|nr:DUF3053 domain-containing protein [Roseiarcaceae bacterium H3SJ34-1]